VLQECEFRGNEGYFGGGLAVNHWSGATLTDCLFVDNVAVRGGAVWGNTTYKERCVFYRNRAVQGGAVWHNGYNVDTSISCTYSHNAASEAGAGIYIATGYGDQAQFIDTIVAYGTAGEAVAVEPGVPVSFFCCDLFGNSGGDWIGEIEPQVHVNGNFSADPCFCDVEGEDFSLCADSWCLPGHHPWGCDQLVGAFGEGCAECDCGGPIQIESSTWGGVKALYR
jgi:hypothetical protein